MSRLIRALRLGSNALRREPNLEVASTHLVGETRERPPSSAITWSTHRADVPHRSAGYDAVYTHALANVVPHIDSGKVYGIVAEPGIDFATTLLGCLLKGAMAVPLGVHLTQAEAHHIVSNAGIDAVVVPTSVASLARAQHTSTETPSGFVSLGGCDLAALPERAHALQKFLPEAFYHSGNRSHPVEVLSAIPFPAELTREDGTRDAVVYDRATIDGELSALEQAVSSNDPAIVIYTSGTTGKPKGVVTTHDQLSYQVTSMLDRWEWTPEDKLLHFLPLHHVHGLVNGLITPICSRASIDIMPSFNPVQVLERIAFVGEDPPTVVMGVPTMYAKILDQLESTYSNEEKRHFREVCEDNIRVMISGSAALPGPILSRWEKATGHVLLERYGMTETGMTLGNPLHGRRVEGAVGVPFPRVIAKVTECESTGFEQDGGTLIDAREASAEEKSVLLEQGYQLVEGLDENAVVEGNLSVKGPSIFSQYLDNTKATSEAFDDDGFFITGDRVRYDKNADVFSILGRLSSDIIKFGGYKLSALEIEREILSIPKVHECAVVGLPDEVYGERVVALITVHENHQHYLDPETGDPELVVAAGAAAQASSTFTLDWLRGQLEDRLASYKLPTYMEVVEEIPRNTMGKISKKDIVARLTAVSDGKE